MSNELELLGLHPAHTTNPARAAQISAAIVADEVTKSRPDEPTNKDKMEHLRSVCNNGEELDLHSLFPYAEAFVDAGAAVQQAGSFIADLRCQYIKKCIDEGLINPILGWLLYTRNRIWHIRLREQVNLFIIGERNRKDDIIWN